MLLYLLRHFTALYNYSLNYNTIYTYWLVCFVSAGITGIGGHHHHGFDLCCPGNDTLDLHDLAYAVSLDLSDWRMFLVAGTFEVYLTATQDTKILLMERHNCHALNLEIWKPQTSSESIKLRWTDSTNEMQGLMVSFHSQGYEEIIIKLTEQVHEIKSLNSSGTCYHHSIEPELHSDRKFDVSSTFISNTRGPKGHISCTWV